MCDQRIEVCGSKVVDVPPIRASASQSVTGVRRHSNQDRLLVEPALGFALLADGVAGRPAGERASQTAIEAAALHLRLVLTKGRCRDVSAAQNLLADAFGFANLAVRRCSDKVPALANMASTLVGVVFTDHHAVFASVGDSRIYRLRHAFLKQVTDDHVLRRKGLESLSEDECAAIRPLQLLTRAIGYSDSIQPVSGAELLVRGDAFLLCSDGLSDVLERYQMAEIVARTGDIDQACRALVDAALAAGADDDVTVVLVQPNLNLAQAP